MVLQNKFDPMAAAIGSLDDQPEIAEALTHLHALIQSTLQRGERRLPAERQLASQFNIGRITIRKALTVLEQDGEVVRHVGRGTFITSNAGSPPPQLQALAHAGALAIDTSIGLSPRELIEVRYALEPAIAELAALAAREVDLQKILKCMSKREESWRIDDYEHWDQELHISIAKATHNSLLIEMLELVNRIRRTAAWRKFRKTSIDEEKRRISNAQHLKIVQAICRADPQAAFNAMRAHLNAVRNVSLRTPLEAPMDDHQPQMARGSKK